MIVGAVALLAYASGVAAVLYRRHARVAWMVLVMLSVWFIVVAAGWALAVRGR